MKTLTHPRQPSGSPRPMPPMTDRRGRLTQRFANGATLRIDKRTGHAAVCLPDGTARSWARATCQEIIDMQRYALLYQREDAL